MTDGTRIGSMRVEHGQGVVRMEDRFATGVEDLWSALTRPDRLARWIGVIEGEPAPGATLRARFTSTWEGVLRVEVCEPPSRLLVASDGGDGDRTELEALVTPDGTGSRLVIEERGLPVANLSAYGAGWQAHVEDLRAHLEGRPAADWSARWAELSPGYRTLEAELR